MRPPAMIALTAALVLAADQATKYAVVIGMNLREIGVAPIWPPFLQFRMAWNEGINFGLFGGGGDTQRWVLVSIALGISAVLAVWGARQGGRLVPIASGVIIGGAVGNAIDRVIWGAVADFLNVSCCGLDNPYSWNIADGAIFLGVVALVIAPGPQKGA